MFKRFFKKNMPEETNRDVTAEPVAPKDANPGVQVPAGPQVPGVDLTQGTSSSPAPEAPVSETPGGSDPAAPIPPEPTPEVPAAKDETIPAAPAADPMKPVGPN